MSLISYCLLLTTEGTSVLHECPSESSSDRTSTLCNTVGPWLFPSPASQASKVLEQHSLSSMQKKYFYGLLVVSCVLYYSSCLKLYNMLSMRSSARAGKQWRIRWSGEDFLLCKCMEPHEGILVSNFVALYFWCKYYAPTRMEKHLQIIGV